MMLNKEIKNLRVLWLAQTISQAGDAIYQLALIWLVLDMTQSTIITGIIAMSAYLPALIFGLYAGVFSDRGNRFKLMLFSNAAQALTVMLIPLALWNGIENAWIICVLAFLRSCFYTLFQPALQSFIPMLFAKEHIVKINSILITSGQVAWMNGPFFAGVLLSVFSLINLFVVDALSFLFAIILLLFVNQPQQHYEDKLNSHWEDLKHGLSYLFSHKSILMMMVITFINNLFIMGPAIVGIPILIRLGLRGSAADFAFVEGFMALGALFGSFLVTKLNKKFNNGIIWGAGLIIDGITFSFFFWADSIPMAMVMIFIHGIGIPMIMVSRTSILQLYSPNKYHGRLFSVVHIGVVGTTALSSALVGIVSDYINIKTIFLFIGIGASLCGLLGLSIKNIRKL